MLLFLLVLLLLFLLLLLHADAATVVFNRTCMFKLGIMFRYETLKHVLFLFPPPTQAAPRFPPFLFLDPRFVRVERKAEKKEKKDSDVRAKTEEGKQRRRRFLMERTGQTDA